MSSDSDIKDYDLEDLRAQAPPQPTFHNYNAVGMNYHIKGGGFNARLRRLKQSCPTLKAVGTTLLMIAAVMAVLYVIFMQKVEYESTKEMWDKITDDDLRHYEVESQINEIKNDQSKDEDAIEHLQQNMKILAQQIHNLDANPKTLEDHAEPVVPVVNVDVDPVLDVEKPLPDDVKVTVDVE